MDKLIKKKIKNTIKKLEESGKKVINTKYFPTFLDQEDFKLSQVEIEDYLEKEDYISISDDYMVYKPSFIKYCNKNNLNTINKLKKNLFMIHSVPYINLTETQLQNILKDSYRNSDRKSIIAEHFGNKHIIDSTKDLIEYGLKKTYISYELFEDFCNIYPDKDRFELVYILQDRDIKLLSKKVEYYIDDRGEEKVVEAEDEGEKKINIATSYLEDYNKLSPKGMISFLEDLEIKAKITFAKKDFLKNYPYSYVKEIVNIGILIDTNDMLLVNPYTKILIDKIKESNNKNEYDKYRKEIDVQGFCNKYNKIIAFILLQNRGLRKLISIIKKANEKKYIQCKELHIIVIQMI